MCFPRLRLWLAFAGLVALAGCAQYSLGPTGALQFHSLYVAPVKNNSYASQAQAPVSTWLRQSLLQEGNLQLASQNDADATLEVTLTDYERRVAATSVDNSLNAQSYTLILSANCSLVDNHTGKFYFKNLQVSADDESFINAGNDFSEPEYQSMVKLARKLSEKIKDAVVGTW